MSQGLVFDIQRFSVHDGPGIRTTVFLKGCPLACLWCQNPEGMRQRIRLWNFDNLCACCGRCVAWCPQQALSPDPGGRPLVDHDACVRCGQCVDECYHNALALDGYEIGDEELARKLLSDTVFFDASGGGVTFSGGDPLAQPDFVRDVAVRLKGRGIATAVETCMDAPWEKLELFVPCIDYFQVDIKILDAERHREATGRDNARILDNFARLAQAVPPGRLRVRIPLVPGYTADTENLTGIARFVAGVNPAIPVELMNFNPLASAKYRRMHDVGFRFADARAYSEAEMGEFRRVVGENAEAVL